VVDAGPVTAPAVASHVGLDERLVVRLLDQRVAIDRMKRSVAPVRYELTSEGQRDLARQRLIYAILGRFVGGTASGIAGLDDNIAVSLGLARRDVSEAGGSVLAAGWVSPRGGSSGGPLEISAAGSGAWAQVRRTCPQFAQTIV
jgi:hypothetical protein